jgi:hypothetical protein
MEMTSKFQEGFGIFYFVHIHFTDIQRKMTIIYMLVELFAQKTNSNFTKREMNC